MSHPTRVRGLKPAHWFEPSRSSVAPHTGAWIETSIDATLLPASSVAPHTGAWIETQNQQSK